MQPTRPETGYGYIRASENCTIAEFAEKPNLEKSQAYLDSGDYPWNSDMFVLRAKMFLDDLAVYREDVFLGDVMAEGSTHCPSFLSRIWSLPRVCVITR
ncbi:sugar phosphate nucleotidyltransferase [Marinomonas shanghaiensis]|uniref:sugar phosphate nucleotidyltransferase n=1 Tax=Marinomonas shanghaiensis TaxID=2202418 RepID=UPI003A8D1A48